MKNRLHERAEILAGAIALQEATVEERIEYRDHLAACPRCLQSLGGEHELERISDRVAEARDCEVWEPDVRGPLISRLSGAPRRIIGYGLGALTICLGISALGHVLVGSQLAQIRPSFQDPLTISYEGDRIVLERRSTRDAKAARKAAPKVVIENVVHHVVRTVRPVSASSVVQKVSFQARPLGRGHAVMRTAHKDPSITQVRVDTYVDDLSHQSVASTVSTVQTPGRGGGSPPAETVATQSRAQGVQRIVFSPSYITREATPEGGDTAINPKYSELAYEEHAEGTVSYEVMIDDQGNPTKFVIVKSSGFLVLDQAVKDAAMRVHYKPAVSNGKPVAGVYRDAFTFSPSSTQD
ncbi:MAG: TonB family protein [Candidatus Eremiobacteraeota bacterium]|nr:TonB family protein [Candidatus Eremiobacteraeota bacterium]